VRKKFGVEPALIPDLLALVGDAQDGYPGIPGLRTDAPLFREVDELGWRGPTDVASGAPGGGQRRKRMIR
jgi:hypothetical protein